MKSFKFFLTVMLAFIAAWQIDGALAGTIKGKVFVRGVRDARDVLVYIEKAPGEFKPSEKPATIDQTNMVFVPHVLPVLAGTTVEFQNNDDVMHNVFTPDKCAEKFNLGSWPKGEERPYTFKDSGCVAVILCNVHPEMEAWVVTLQNPYFFKTNKDGAFTIENVPVGKYTLKVWHKKLKGKSQEIEVPKEGDISIDFKMKR